MHAYPPGPIGAPHWGSRLRGTCIYRALDAFHSQGSPGFGLNNNSPTVDSCNAQFKCCYFATSSQSAVLIRSPSGPPQHWPPYLPWKTHNFKNKVSDLSNEMCIIIGNYDSQSKNAFHGRNWLLQKPLISIRVWKWWRLRRWNSGWNFLLEPTGFDFQIRFRFINHNHAGHPGWAIDQLINLLIFFSHKLVFPSPDFFFGWTKKFMHRLICLISGNIF